MCTFSWEGPLPIFISECGVVAVMLWWALCQETQEEAEYFQAAAFSASAGCLLFAQSSLAR